jgi:drug/metabolite transporter (DMT)-like permease
VGLCYGSAAVVLWLVVLFSGQPTSGYDTATVGAFWAMALIPQLIGHTTSNWALRFFNPGFIAVVLLGEPVLATLMAYWIFGEALTVLKAAGGMLILAGIYLAASEKLGG